MEIKDKELHRIALTAIIYRKDRTFLITRRSLAKKAFPGKWTVPGGGLSTDDYTNTPAKNDQWYGAIELGLRREVKEETGLTIGKPEYLCDLTFVHPGGFPVLVLSYFAEYAGGETQIQLDPDSVDAKWVTAAEAATFDMIPGIAEEIKDVDEILQKRAL
jgi:8-oxo-dGTP pyrophosphatase MutT (NUDIX family)